MRQSLLDLIAALLALGLAWKVFVKSRRLRGEARSETKLGEDENGDGSCKPSSQA